MKVKATHPGIPEKAEQKDAHLVLERWPIFSKATSSV
jgi:hypothetical protein